ncbi:MAG TPA: DEAD/DEAH box helicase, partial [Candidatus Lokiarchaeia archaeon]|nr:DEAD/DEAH box helicase [Candidatus Lokiarchaeia archaeon]
MAEIPTKPFFLSIEKDHEHPKLDIFVVHLFYLIKYARGQLEYHEEPFFTGRLEIFFERSHWRPFRFYLPPLAQGMDPRYLDNRLFAKLAGAAQFCALPETADAAIQETLQDLLQTVQATKVEQFTFCESCLRKNKFTFLDPRSIFRGTNGVIECRVCAGADLLVRVRDVVETSPNLRNLLRDLLNKFKDVDKVANLFATNIHSLADPSRTLYDSKKEHHQKIDQKKVTLDKLPLPSELISRLTKKGFTELLPAQVLAVEAGLLEGASELIISSTSSGKTLIAELAGIPKLLQHAQAGGDSRQVPKLLYVVPLVALANQRGDEWAHRYRPLGISVVTKVGVKQFDPEARAARSKANKGVQSADIIVGTYEGVDVLVRKGRTDLLGNPATIVIDEIQMLGDPERGWFLDGFISRLRSIYPRAQFLYLSATISEPQELAAQLQAVLVEYNGRPVPIERHFILCATRDEKTRVAGML